MRDNPDGGHPADRRRTRRRRGRRRPPGVRELYDQHCRQSYSLARRICVDPKVAEDAVQEAFLSFWRDPTRFDTARGSFSTWMLTLVHRRSVDAVRRESTHRSRSVPGGDEVVGRVTPVAAGADELALRAVIGDQVREALRQLPNEQRQVIELAYFDGRTQSEVSAGVMLPSTPGLIRFAISREPGRAMPAEPTDVLAMGSAA